MITTEKNNYENNNTPDYNNNKYLTFIDEIKNENDFYEIKKKIQDSNENELIYEFSKELLTKNYKNITFSQKNIIYDETIVILQNLSKKNHTKSQYLLGVIYFNRKIYFKSFRYFELALKNDYLDAAYYLGLLFEFGLGVEKDINKAEFLYIKASQTTLGHSAMFRLGILYLNKKVNGRIKIKEALYWLEKAATLQKTLIDVEMIKSLKKENTPVLVDRSTLMMKTSTTMTTKRDLDFERYLRKIKSIFRQQQQQQPSQHSLQLLEKEKRKNRRLTIQSLGSSYSDDASIQLGLNVNINHDINTTLLVDDDDDDREADDEASNPKAKASIEVNLEIQAEACFLLHRIYENGYGGGIIEKNLRLSKYYLNVASTNGSTNAMFNKGIYFSTSLEITRNWIKKAAENGHLYSQLMLCFWNLGGSPNHEINESKALFWLQCAAKLENLTSDLDKINQARIWYILGTFYEEGIAYILEPDDQEARVLYKLAALRNIPEAQSKMEELDETEDDEGYENENFNYSKKKKNKSKDRRKSLGFDKRLSRRQSKSKFERRFSKSGDQRYSINTQTSIEEDMISYNSNFSMGHLPNSITTTSSLTPPTMNTNTNTTTTTSTSTNTTTTTVPTTNTTSATSVSETPSVNDNSSYNPTRDDGLEGLNTNENDLPSHHNGGGSCSCSSSGHSNPRHSKGNSIYSNLDNSSYSTTPSIELPQDLSEKKNSFLNKSVHKTNSILRKGSFLNITSLFDRHDHSKEDDLRSIDEKLYSQNLGNRANMNHKYQVKINYISSTILSTLSIPPSFIAGIPPPPPPPLPAPHSISTASASTSISLTTKPLPTKPTNNPSTSIITTTVRTSSLPQKAKAKPIKSTSIKSTKSAVSTSSSATLACSKQTAPSIVSSSSTLNPSLPVLPLTLSKSQQFQNHSSTPSSSTSNLSPIIPNSSSSSSLSSRHTNSRLSVLDINTLSSSLKNSQLSRSLSLSNATSEIEKLKESQLSSTSTIRHSTPIEVSKFSILNTKPPLNTATTTSTSNLTFIPQNENKPQSSSLPSTTTTTQIPTPSLSTQTSSVSKTSSLSLSNKKDEEEEKDHDDSSSSKTTTSGKSINSYTLSMTKNNSLSTTSSQSSSIKIPSKRISIISEDSKCSLSDKNSKFEFEEKMKVETIKEEESDDDAYVDNNQNEDKINSHDLSDHEESPTPSKTKSNTSSQHEEDEKASAFNNKIKKANSLMYNSKNENQYNKKNKKYYSYILDNSNTIKEVNASDKNLNFNSCNDSEKDYSFNTIPSIPSILDYPIMNSSPTLSEQISEKLPDMFLTDVNSETEEESDMEEKEEEIINEINYIDDEYNGNEHKVDPKFNIDKAKISETISTKTTNSSSIASTYDLNKNEYLSIQDTTSLHGINNNIFDTSMYCSGGDSDNLSYDSYSTKRYNSFQFPFIKNNNTSSLFSDEISSRHEIISESNSLMNIRSNSSSMGKNSCYTMDDSDDYHLKQQPQQPQQLKQKQSNQKLKGKKRSLLKMRSFIKPFTEHDSEKEKKNDDSNHNNGKIKNSNSKKQSRLSSITHLTKNKNNSHNNNNDDINSINNSYYVSPPSINNFNDKNSIAYSNSNSSILLNSSASLNLNEDSLYESIPKAPNDSFMKKGKQMLKNRISKSKLLLHKGSGFSIKSKSKLKYNQSMDTTSQCSDDINNNSTNNYYSTPVTSSPPSSIYLRKNDSTTTNVSHNNLNNYRILPEGLTANISKKNSYSSISNSTPKSYLLQQRSLTNNENVNPNKNYLIENDYHKAYSSISPLDDNLDNFQNDYKLSDHHHSLNFPSSSSSISNPVKENTSTTTTTTTTTNAKNKFDLKLTIDSSNQASTISTTYSNPQENVNSNESKSMDTELLTLSPMTPLSSYIYKTSLFQSTSLKRL